MKIKILSSVFAILVGTFIFQISLSIFGYIDHHLFTNDNLKPKNPNIPFDVQKQDMNNYVYLPLIQNGKQGYYVSPSGNDSNPGTFSLPWKTINKAARSIIPGDIVYIRGGIYYEYVTISRSGNASQPIRFEAYPGENVVLDGNNTLPTSEDGLLTLDGDWIIVEGLEVKNSIYYGIAVFGKHNTLTNVYVHHSSRNGVYLNGDYGILEKSRVWRNSMRNEYGANPGGSSGVATARDETDGTTEYVVIRKNQVWENWGQGINVHHSKYTVVEDNIVSDSYTTNLYIHDTTDVICQRNLVFMNPDNSYMGNLGPKVGLMMGQEYGSSLLVNLKNVQVINNLFYGNHRNLFWYTGDIGGAGMTDVLIANNTFANGSGDSSGGNANVILDEGVNTNVRFINNIVLQDNQLPLISIEDLSGIFHSYNLWSKNPGFTLTVGEAIADPAISRLGSPFEAGWFELLGTSPAINKAIILPEVPNDFRSRYRGVDPDIGAMEYFP